VHVVTNTPGNVDMVPGGFRLHGGGRVYFATEAANDFSNPWMYWQAPLLGNHISYTVDVSNVGCHCNAAFYWVQMPGHDQGQAGPTQPHAAASLLRPPRRTPGPDQGTTSTVMLTMSTTTGSGAV
jgi:hypothetical protein